MISSLGAGDTHITKPATTVAYRSSPFVLENQGHTVGLVALKGELLHQLSSSLTTTAASETDVGLRGPKNRREVDIGIGMTVGVVIT